MPDTKVLSESRAQKAAPPERKGRRLWKRVQKELRSLVPAWVFFYVLFSLLRLTQTAVLTEHHITASPPSRVLIGSLIVAKSVLLVDLIPFLRRLESKPVVVAAAGKTVSYFLIVFIFEYLDLLVVHRREGLTAATRRFGSELTSSLFWVLQLWMFLLLFTYSATRALSRTFGAKRFREVLFGRSSEA
jgi:hypothetical protein